MKRFFQISGMALLIMLFADLRNPAAAQPGGDVSYQNFYDELSPYGRWIDYPDYGYVWCPNEGADFRPYSSNGRWVWSDDYEWMWVSDYSWGWAPFHYGRWFYDDMYGWMWVPGYDWSPAWVAWRGGGEYYGWAPLRPGINISFGFSIGSYQCPDNYWCFAPSRYITSPRIYDYCVNSRQNLTIINNTTIINNYNYNRNVFVTGPRRNEVERFTNQRINAVRVRDISSPGRSGFHGNEVSVYRPGIQRVNNRDFAPRRFDNYRGNNNIAGRNDGRTGRNNDFNDRGGRINNNDRFGERHINNDVQRQQQNNRQFEQRDINRNPESRNQRGNEQQARPDNGVRERSAREVFGRDNRPGIDQPVQRDRFERRDRSFNNENRARNDNNNNFDRRLDNNNRVRENMPARQERSDVFNNRGNNQPQPQRQSFPQMNQRQQEQPRRFESQPQRQSFPQANQRQQEQPRRFEAQPQSRGNNSDNNRGGFGRGRRG